MSMTDPVADMITRIRNACMVKKVKLEMPSSKLKVNLAAVLKDEGFISGYKTVKDNKQGILKINLKYDENNISAIEGLKRISKPGCRVFVRSDNLPKVINGYGIAIISTSKGLMVDRAARKTKIGGEVICEVW